MQRVALWLALVGCAPTVADDAISTCVPLCRCTDVPVPGEQDACTASCETAFERNPLSSDCVACVVDHATECTTLIDDCTSACSEAVPLASYERGPRQ